MPPEQAGMMTVVLALLAWPSVTVRVSVVSVSEQVRSRLGFWLLGVVKLPVPDQA